MRFTGAAIKRLWPVGTRGIARAIFHLYLIQGCRYLVPLVTVPYLLRTLGLSAYGLLALACSLTSILVVITNFGFQLSATRQIAVCGADRHRRSEVFCAVLLLKTGLCCFSALLLVALMTTVPVFRDNRGIMAACFLAVIGNVLFPNWYLLGTERTRQLAATVAAGKILYLAGVLTVVRSPQDVIAAALLQSSVDVTAGIIAGVAIFRSSEIGWLLPQRQVLIDVLEESREIFASQIYGTMLTQSNTIILGLFAGREAVGAFAAADKVIRAIIGCTAPLANGLYPRVCRWSATICSAAAPTIRRTLLAGGTVLMLIAAGLVVGAESCAALLLGMPDAGVAILLVIMASVPLAVFIYNMLGFQILLQSSLRRCYSVALRSAALFSVVAAVLLVPIYGELATAAIFTVAEWMVAVLIIQSVRQSGFDWCPDTVKAPAQSLSVPATL